MSYCALESQRSNAAPVLLLIPTRSLVRTSWRNRGWTEGKSSMAKKKTKKDERDGRGHLPPSAATAATIATARRQRSLDVIVVHRVGSDFGALLGRSDRICGFPNRNSGTDSLP